MSWFLCLGDLNFCRPNFPIFYLYPCYMSDTCIFDYVQHLGTHRIIFGAASVLPQFNAHTCALYASDDNVFDKGSHFHPNKLFMSDIS